MILNKNSNKTRMKLSSRSKNMFCQNLKSLLGTRRKYLQVNRLFLYRFVQSKNKISYACLRLLWYNNVTIIFRYSHGGNVKGKFELRAHTKRFYNNEIIASVNKTKQVSMFLFYLYLF